MTEECGLIGNWLTWPRYTWSHNISHPSHMQRQRSRSFSYFCFSVEKIVWMKPCCLTRSTATLKRQGGEDLCMTDAASPTVHAWERPAARKFHKFRKCRCPATVSNKTILVSRQQSDVVPLPGWCRFVTCPDWVCWMQCCARFHTSYLVGKNLLILLCAEHYAALVCILNIHLKAKQRKLAEPCDSSQSSVYSGSAAAPYCVQNTSKIKYL